MPSATFLFFFLTFSHCSEHNTQMGILDKPRQGGIEAEMEYASGMTGEDNQLGASNIAL